MFLYEHKSTATIDRYQLTRSFLCYFLSRDGESREYLYHDFYNNIRHRRSRPHFRIRLKSSEKVFNPLEKIDEHVLARIHVLGRLEYWCHNGQDQKMEEDTHQEKDPNTSKYYFRR